MENNLFQQISFLPAQLPLGFTQLFSPQFSLFTELDSNQGQPKTRGRKKLRPGNPLKTEVLDKYWLRAFKNYIKGNYFEIKSMTLDKEFWTWYISKGKPGKDGEFLSYNSQYKQKLFSNPSFCAAFVAWAMNLGCYLSPKKSLKASWEYYFNYFFQELIPSSFNQANMEDFKRCYQFIYEKSCLEAESADSTRHSQYYP